jgi:hypothetical protein
MNKKKKKNLINIHKQNGNIFRFQQKILKYQRVILISLIERDRLLVSLIERERDRD